MLTITYGVCIRKVVEFIGIELATSMESPSSFSMSMLSQIWGTQTPTEDIYPIKDQGFQSHDKRAREKVANPNCVIVI